MSVGSTSISITQPKSITATLSSVSLSEPWRPASIIHGLGLWPFHPLLTIAEKTSSDMFASIKFTGLIRFGHNYSPVWLLIKLWKKAIPSGAKRAAHIDFVKTKAKERLDRETDRKDLTAYASLFPPSIIVLIR